MKNKIKFIEILFFFFSLLFINTAFYASEKVYVIKEIIEKFNTKKAMSKDEIEFYAAYNEIQQSMLYKFSNIYWVTMSIAQILGNNIQYIIKPYIAQLILKYKLRKRITYLNNKFSIKNIIGYSTVKETCLGIISEIQKQKNTKIYKKNDGILFYGPSGCGKTTFAKTIAYEAKVPIISITSKDLINDSGVMTDQLDILLDILKKYTNSNIPCVLLLDEFDFLVGNRDNKELSDQTKRAIQTFLEKIEDTSLKGIFIIACTNHKENIDSALLRPGRFGVHVEVNIPTKDDIELLCTQYNKNLLVNSANFIGLSVAEIIKKLTE